MTTQVNEQELKKKLAEWAGFICYWEEGATDGLWQYPDEPVYQKRKHEPDFPQSLDACFRWLWSRAVQTLADSDLSSIEEATHKLFYLWAVEWVTRLNDNPALALCLTIEKLVDKDKK